MSRLAMALVAYLLLGALAFTTLSDPRIRSLTLLILALFAFKSWVRRKDVLHPDDQGESETEHLAEKLAADREDSFGPM